jgi:hypothetical protein
MHTLQLWATPVVEEGGYMDWLRHGYTPRSS